jgi:membrane-bound serine protease (ClpP class)
LLIYADHGLTSPREELIEASWSESLVGFLTSPLVSMLLLGIGILGIWVEIKTPGFGVPGVVGILAIAVLLFGHHLAGLAEIPEILLFAAGAAFLVLEIFAFSSGGVLAILGVVCMLAGLVLSLQDFTLPDPGRAPWQTDVLLSSLGRVLFSFVGAAFGLLVVLRFLPNVPVLGRLVHVAEISGTAPEPGASRDLVGREGHSVTPLKPGGKIEVDGQMLDVVADGDYVAAGETVEVLRIEGTRIVVARTKR